MFIITNQSTIYKIITIEKQSIEKLKGDISVLETTEPSKLWLKDLERFEKEYHKVYKQHD